MLDKLINNSSDHSGTEIVLMIELKNSNKKKVIGFVKKKPATSKSLIAIDSISEETELTTKIPLISKFISPLKVTTIIKSKNLKKQTSSILNNKTAIFSTNKVSAINNLFTTSPLTITSIKTSKNIHCYDFSHYCKWWKIHNLCKKPEVVAKCNLSCLPECQI